MPSPKVRLAAAVGGSATLLALAGAPLAVHAADHLDAPPVGLQLVSPNGRGDADINDLYVFRGAQPGRTVLAVTTNPAAGVVAPRFYADDVSYVINIDRNGDAVRDMAYVLRFSRERNGVQSYRVLRTGARLTDNHQIGQGMTGRSSPLRGGGMSFAGLRSDPFFFDLAAFRSEVGGAPLNRTFCDANTNDFFAPLNTNGIVLQVPDADLGGRGKTVGVWTTTSDSTGGIDQMGRPAINTVFNHDQAKNVFNHTPPSRQFGPFHADFVQVLRTFSGLDKEGPYTRKQATALAHVLLPDVLTYKIGTKPAGPLNGRALRDDVIDVELNLVTGGFPFPGRDAKGAIPSDCVGPHHDYLGHFPYLGQPHR